MALSNSQYNAVMRGYEERQRLQRGPWRHGLRRYTKKYRRSRNWTARSVPGRQTAPGRVLGGDTKAREHLKEDLADLKEQKLTLLKASRISGRLHGASL